MLTGYLCKRWKEFLLAKAPEKQLGKKKRRSSSEFPTLKEIYSTVFTNASGIKQTVVVGNVEETVEATTPWFSKDGLVWADMSTPTDFSLPSYEESSNHVLWKPIPHDGWRV